MGNKYNEHITEEIVRRVLTFDQDVCFESIKKQMLERISTDASNERDISMQEYISIAEALICFYFTDHHIPYGYYTMDFIERKYPELVQRIREMVKELVITKD